MSCLGHAIATDIENSNESSAEPTMAYPRSFVFGLCTVITLRYTVHASLLTPSVSNVEPPEMSTLPDHRTILQPGIWKIRTVDKKDTLLVYQFSLEENPNEQLNSYPDCSYVACRGLPDSTNQGCDNLCKLETFREASATFETAKTEYKRSSESLNVIFGDLSALMNTHIINPKGSAFERVSKVMSKANSIGGPITIDVLQRYRTRIRDATSNLDAYLSSDSEHLRVNPAFGPYWNKTLINALDIWKAGALRLAVQLNAATFAFQGAYQRLLSCAQGVYSSDMTGCEPGFITGYYTDVPVASVHQGPSKLSVLVRRDYWKPVALSHWYMAFIDTSKNNRTCWLSKAMVSDGRSDYSEPVCDYRGLCQPLIPENATVTACSLNDIEKFSASCPVVCEGNCFGPLCYQPERDTYTLRTIALGNDTTDNHHVVFLRTSSPRVLSKVYSLSDLEIPGYLATIHRDTDLSSELLNQGQTVIQDILRMSSDAQVYIEKLTQIENSRSALHASMNECDHMTRRARIMGAVSVALSVITCPLLIWLIIRVKTNPRNRSCQSCMLS